MQIRRHSGFASSCNYTIAADHDLPENILEKIVWHKETEVALAQQSFALDAAMSYVKFAPPIRNFSQAIRTSCHQPALIAEVKKASPSRGIIKSNFDPVAIAQAYERGGATCLSVLTDIKFFQGGFVNLSAIRQAVNIPLLCKEFIIEPYQIYIARLHGADAILLIAAILTDQDLMNLSAIARHLCMSVLIEVHTAQELERVMRSPLNLATDLIGINNRNLETFTVDINNTKNLLSSLSDQQRSQIVWVSESGLYTNSDLQFVASHGANAVLVGESLIKQANIERSVKLLLGADI